MQYAVIASEPIGQRLNIGQSRIAERKRLKIAEIVRAGFDPEIVFEIEISPTGIVCGTRTHSQVRERPVDSGTGYAAIYPTLAAGRYTIWRDHHTPVGSVMVAEGKVTRYDWS